MSKLIGEMFDGPLDIVGDIHGEIDSLHKLLVQLGYDEQGRHPNGRRIIFLGDLIDRGPDSPAVVEWVRQLVEDGRAQCILGNHELNILRNDSKEGNDWFMAPTSKGVHPFVPATDQQKQNFTAFFMSLPLALEREDLRVVHASWHLDSVAKLATLDGGVSALEAFIHFESQLQKSLTPYHITDEMEARLTDKPNQPTMDEGLANYESGKQMGNPVRVLTSGEELPAEEPFWAGGKWRMVKREKWWDNYENPRPVIMGHYWRYASKDALKLSEKHGPNLFKGIEPHHWMGARKNVYCVDFSVGLRHKARAANWPEDIVKLAALRWPEQTLRDEDGGSFKLS